MNWEDNNLLFDSGVTRDTPIYKYIPLDYVTIMLHEQKLRFSKISIWDDPYENPVLKQRLWRDNNGVKEPIDLSILLDNIYGQSWTLLEESDAMWRIYSHDKQAVRIRTTIGKLFDAIYNPDNYDSQCTFVGEIIYDDEIVDWFFDSFPKNGIIESFCKNTGAFRDMLLYKREAFKHEQEVRFYYVNPRVWNNAFTDTPSAISEFKEYDIDFNNIFDEICFDPRLDETLYEARKLSLSNMGYPAESITKSNLYKLKSVDIKVHPLPENLFEQMEKAKTEVLKLIEEKRKQGATLADILRDK